MSLVDNWIDALPSDALSFLDNVPHIESHSPPPHLHSLPVELHQNVFKFLPPQDIGRLREASEWFASPFGSTLSASKHRLFTIPPAPMHSDMETFHSNFWRVVPIAYHLKVECAEVKQNNGAFTPQK